MRANVTLPTYGICHDLEREPGELLGVGDLRTMWSLDVHVVALYLPAAPAQWGTRNDTTASSRLLDALVLE